MTENNPTSLNCPACGAPLDFDGNSAVVRCKFCGNVSLMPGVLQGRIATSAGFLEEVRRLASSGNLIEAVRKYRSAYGVGLKEAKEAVEALQAGRLVSPSAPGARSPEELTKVIQAAQDLLAQGKKIEAIKLYRENFDVSLTRATYAIEQIQAGQTLQPEAGFETQPLPSREVSTVKTGKWLGAVITVAILLFVGGILAFVLLQPGGPLVSHYYPADKNVFLPASPSTVPDIAVWFYDSKADNRFIGLVNPDTGKLLWKGEPLAGDGYVDGLAAGPDLIYAASGTDLQAYRRSNGSLAWQALMTDKLNYSDFALLVTAVRVITNNADQSIQAYNANNGSPAWSLRLNGYDRSLRLINNSLAVIDYIDSDYHYGLIFLDLLTGNRLNAIIPVCTYNDYDMTMDLDSGLVYDRTAGALFIVYDSPYSCIQRINLATGKADWTNANSDSFNFSPDGFQYLQSDTSLYFSSGNELQVVNKATGEMQSWSPNPDYEVLPLAVTGDTLIARARRTRGTEKFELWGLDIASGNLAWQVDMQGAKPIEPPDEMAGLVDKTDWGWTWKLTPAGLSVITFQGDPNQILLQTYKVADGTNVDSQTLPLKNVTGTFYGIPALIGWQGNIAYMSLESNIYSLDLNTGKLKQVY
jgi:ribosomal protein L7/L12